MWSSLQIEVSNRITASRDFFTSAQSINSSGINSFITTAKGLIYIQLYALYEFTVKGIVQAGLKDIQAHSTPFNSIRMELLGIALDPDLASIINCSKDRIWETKTSFFQKINSHNPTTFPELFPSDGSHFRPKQLYTIWDIFGIKAPIIPTGYNHQRITELVNNRNSIAHGETTAENIGRNYSIQEIEARIMEIEQICMYLIGTMQNHCSNNLNFIK